MKLWVPKRDPLIKPPSGLARINWSHPLTRGLQGCWLFNERSGKSRNLVTQYLESTTTSAPTWVGTSRGMGMNFSGSAQGIKVQNRTYLLPNAPGATITALLAGNSTQTASEGMIVFIDKGTADSTRLELSYTGSGGKITVYARTVTETQLTATSVTTLTTKVFYTVSFVCDCPADKVRIYINGKFDNQNASGTFTQDYFANTTPVNASIGSLSPGVGGFDFSGLIVYVYLHNRAFSADEISYLHGEPYSFFEPISTRKYFVAGGAQPETITVDKWHREPVLPQRYPLEVVSY